MLAGASPALATSYVKTSTIVSGNKYVLVANITNYPIGPAHTPAPTVLGSTLMNGMLGTQSFTTNGNYLTGGLGSWEFTVVSSGSSLNGDPGFTIRYGALYLDLGQGPAGVFDVQSPSIDLGAVTVTYREFVSNPFTYLSSNPRVWYWDGARFYTVYTSNTASVGGYVSHPTWPGYYYNVGAPYGTVWIEWYTPWGAYGSRADGSSQYGADFTSRKFYLMGMRPGDDRVFPPGFFDPASPMGQLRSYQYYFAERMCVAASVVEDPFESPGSNDLYPSSLEVKNISMYERFVDNASPSLSLQPNKVAEATGPGGAVVTWAAIPSNDTVEGPITPVCTPPSGSTFPIGDTTVTVVASDSSGNAISVKFKVTVRDTTGPAISGVPANMVVEAAGPGGAAASWTAPTANDLVSGDRPVVCSPPSGSNFPLGTTTVSVVSTDAVGNTSTRQFNVTVSDTTAPSITGLPTNPIAEATGPSGATVTWTAPTATDLVDGARPVTCSPPSGSTFPVGNTTVSVTSSDAAGNTATEQFTVTVRDTTGPSISGTSDKIAEATGPSGATVTWTPPTATDLVDGARGVVCSPPSGSTFPVGNTTVSVTTTDAAGNSSSKQFTVTVRDTTGPSIAGVSDKLAEATGPSGATVTWAAPTATDLVGGNRTVTCSPASGSTFPIGNTTVSVTTTDTAGNSSSTQFTVTVRDTTGPSISGIADKIAEATGPSGTTVTWTAPTATDLVDGARGVVCSPPSGSTFPIGNTTVSVTTTDSAGNSSSRQFTVTVADATGPSISGVSDKLVEATGPSGATVTWASPTATDLVDGDLSVVCSPVSGSTFPIGNTTVSVTATDAAGNSSSTQFTVTVRDTTGPAVSGVPVERLVEATGPSGATVTWAAPTATDLVDGGVSLVCSPPSGSTFSVGVTTVSVTATDAAGNSSTKTFAVTVSDTTAPSIGGVPADLVAEATGPDGAVVRWTAPTAADIVDGSVEAICSPPSGSTFRVGVTTVDITATDAHGNKATQHFMVTVGDRVAPSLRGVPQDLVVEATGPDGGKASWAMVSGIDLVDGWLAAVCSPPSGSTLPMGTTTVTVTVTDRSKNSSSDHFKVTVSDTTGPLIDVPANKTAEATSPRGAVVTWAPIAANDRVDGKRSAVCSPSSGSTFPMGTTTVTVTATDTAGNRSNDHFTVTVSDTKRPSFSRFPKDMIVEATGPLGARVKWAAPIAVDLVGGNITPACSPPSGSAFRIGVTTVTVTATDTAGNSLAKRFTVTVVPRRIAKIGTITFRYDSTKLTPAAKRKLRRFARAIGVRRYTFVALRGFSSIDPGRGSSAKRKAVSLKRAKNAKIYLLAQLKAMHIRTKVVAAGYGSARPIATNRTRSGRARNRRVELWAK